MLEKLRSGLEKALDPKTTSKSEMLRRHFQLTVVDDEKRFSGAEYETILHAAREWAAEDVIPWIRAPDDPKRGGIERIKASILNLDKDLPFDRDFPYPVYYLPPRWRFCLMVDEVCLRMLDRPEDERWSNYFNSGDVVIKLVYMNFCQKEEEEYYKKCHSDLAEEWQVQDEGIVWDGGVTPLDEEYVGWQYILASEHVKWYNRLMDDEWFEHHYVRPQKEDWPAARYA